MFYPFQVGSTYTRSDIYKIIGLYPEPKGGDWDTGYTPYGDDFFIFSNIGAAGRTGHNYANKFLGERLEWYGKGPSRIHHPLIRKLLDPDRRIYLFWRDADRLPFTFAGLATAEEAFDEQPVRVIWRLRDPGEPDFVSITEQIDERRTYVEGATKTVVVNAYERSRPARDKCISHWGSKCIVCDFNFGERYGPFAEGFIHVHHLVPLSQIRETYVLDPVADLRPVCPNCHAMLHRRDELMSIEELKELLASRPNN